jgi:hypothetical protein
MPDTVVEQVRTTIEPTPGAVKYRITSTVIDKGDLPFPELFVYKINDPVDDSNDTFERVANPNDLQNIIPDRVTAVANGKSYFLWSVLVRDYIDIEIAVQAIVALEGRINTAVTTWVTYQTEFAGTEIDNYPSEDQELVEALEAEYATAKTARITAETAVTTADTDLLLAQAAAELAIEKVDIYLREVQFCDEARVTYWLQYHSGVGTYKSGMTTFFDALILAYNTYSAMTYPAGPPGNDWNSTFYALNAAAAVKASFNSVEPLGTSLDSTFSTFCGQVNSNYNGAVADKSLKDQAVAAAVTAKEEAEAALSSAQTAEDEALAAVVAVCPSFDPNSR